MLKYLASVALVVGLSVYVSVQYKQHPENAAPKTQQPSSEPLNAHTNQQAETNVGQPKWNPPRWYRIFGWPDGIQVWGLFLTLLAIAEQTHHTARAADAANRALVSALRPRVIVRRVRIHMGTHVPAAGIPDADPWNIIFYVANAGGTVAKITSYSFMLDRYAGRIPIVHFQKAGDPFSLQPGEEREMAIPAGKELTFILRNIGAEGLRRGDQNTNRMFFHGYLQYADDLGVKRNTCALRHYRGELDRFNPVDDPEYEYAD